MKRLCLWIVEVSIFASTGCSSNNTNTQNATADSTTVEKADKAQVADTTKANMQPADSIHRSDPDMH
jgi:hypothetical protein